jgi:hypothetical protein
MKKLLHLLRMVSIFYQICQSAIAGVVLWNILTAFNLIVLTIPLLSLNLKNHMQFLILENLNS